MATHTPETLQLTLKSIEDFLAEEIYPLENALLEQGFAAVGIQLEEKR